MRQRHWARIHRDAPELGQMDKTQISLHTLLQVLGLPGLAHSLDIG